MKKVIELLDYLKYLPSLGKIHFSKNFQDTDYYTAIGQIKAQIEALDLPRVSQQGELLVDFWRYLKQENVEYDHPQHQRQLVDEYLKSINWG